MHPITVPLFIHGEQITGVDGKHAVTTFAPNPDNPHNANVRAVKATPELCIEAVESCARAFSTWKLTHPSERRKLFNKLATALSERSEEIQSLMEEEINCSSTFAKFNVSDTIALSEQTAAIISSGVLSGVVPSVLDPAAHAVVVKEPLGVVLGIAPWNAPLVLGFRAVASAVAAGNTAILNPRTQFFIAKLFHEVGFPPGVVNYVQHTPEDAARCFGAMISHKAVRKCNFTGSTAVGRIIAQSAALNLKPVLLELGGKNVAIVLQDADLQQAADQVLLGAFLNSGQICMSTDLVMVARPVEEKFRRILQERASMATHHITKLINYKSDERISSLLKDSQEKGGSLKGEGRIIDGVTTAMNFWTIESFGPLVGIHVFDSEEEPVKVINESAYGLSGAIFSQNYLKAIKMAQLLDTGAVHINSGTVHDEPTLPHGGRKESGWGRFGAHWGIEEFLQTKTIIVHP